MNRSLKEIEDIYFSSTESKILSILKQKDEVSLKYISYNINVLYATLCKELKKLQLKDVISIDNNVITLTKFGKSIINFNDFKYNILSNFCEVNKIDNTTLSFMKKSNYNMKVLLGIKNLLRKKE